MSPVETALRIDRDTPLHMKLGLAASIGVFIFLGGRWSESKLHDFEQLQGQMAVMTSQVTSLAGEVRLLKEEVMTRNEDLTALMEKLKTYDRSDYRPDVASKRTVRRASALLEGAGRQGLSRLDGE